MTLFAENRNCIEITGTLLVFLAPENTVFRCQKLKVGTKVGTDAVVIYGKSFDSFLSQSIAKW